MTVIFSFTEATTPFVNFRWFLYETDLKNSSLYAVNGLVLWLSWFVIRIALIPFIVYKIYLWYFDYSLYSGVVKFFIAFQLVRTWPLLAIPFNYRELINQTITTTKRRRRRQRPDQYLRTEYFLVL